jgi:non-homologous end joining protein Ku
MRLSLVTCPVALYPARSEFEKISFNQLNLLALVSTVSMLADGVKAQGP